MACFNAWDIGACGCGGGGITCSPCDIPMANLTLTMLAIGPWVNSPGQTLAHPAASGTLTYNSSSGIWCGHTVAQTWSGCIGQIDHTGGLGNYTVYLKWTLACYLGNIVLQSLGYPNSNCTGTGSPTLGNYCTGGIPGYTITSSSCSPFSLISTFPTHGFGLSPAGWLSSLITG